MMTNTELATALERAASLEHDRQGFPAATLREAARRLRAHDAADITTRHLLADAVTGRYGTVSKLVDEVERLRAVIAQNEALVSQMRRDEANRVEQINAHWSGEVERLRAAVQRVANERDEAQVDCDRWRDAHKLAAMRADAMDWLARDSVWSANVAALAMEQGLAERERERAANDDLLRRILTLMDACDARDSRLARAEAVVEAAHHITRCHNLSCAGAPCTCGLDELTAALAAWDEEGRSDG